MLALRILVVLLLFHPQPGVIRGETERRVRGEAKDKRRLLELADDDVFALLLFLLIGALFFPTSDVFPLRHYTLPVVGTARTIVQDAVK